MPAETEAQRARRRRHRRKQKIAKYGEEFADVDMRGRHGNHARGSQNPKWSDARMLSEHGYVKIRVGRSHPMADPNGYAYEHILIACTAIGRALTPDEVVHHVNHDRTDNRIENLRVMLRSEHAREHMTATQPWKAPRQTTRPPGSDRGPADAERMERTGG